MIKLKKSELTTIHVMIPAERPKKLTDKRMLIKMVIKPIILVYCLLF